MRKTTNARWLLLVLTPLILAFIIASCSDDTTTNPTTNKGDTANGRYLAMHVAGCIGCHTPVDPTTHQPLPGKEFAGGYEFNFGIIHAFSANLTSDSATGIGAMTDEQIIAAIRTGIATHTHDGHTETDTLVIMPSQNLAYLTDTDVKDIVAFLRTLPAVSNAIAEPTGPLLSFFRMTAATQLQGYPQPSTNTAQTSRGRYLAIIGNCNDCHTPADPQTFAPIMTQFLAGGQVFEKGPQDTVWSANLTPDTTGLKNWRDSQIDSVLTHGIDDEGGKICPPMPWEELKGMTKADRDALIAFLRVIPAVNNKVPEKTKPCE